MLLGGVVYGAFRKNALQSLEDRNRAHRLQMQEQREESVQKLKEYFVEVDWTVDEKDSQNTINNHQSSKNAFTYIWE